MKCAKRTRRVMENSKKQPQGKTLSSNNTPQANKRPHKIELEHMHSMSISGVVDVPTFTDKCVVVKLAGEALTINGNGLAVKNLDTESGILLLEGQVYSLKYSQAASPKSIVGRIFK